VSTLARLFVAGVGVMLTGGLGAVALHRFPRLAARTFAALMILGCSLLTAAAVGVLAGGDAGQWQVATTLPGGPWVFGLDALTAFFLLAIAVVGAAAAIYGTGYLAGDHGPAATAVAHAIAAVLLAALALVVTARAAVPFLIAWEVMAVSAFLLVVTEHERAEVRRAGLIYLVATHTATLALIGMFAVWGAAAPDLTFASLAHPSGAGRSAVLLLALLGFGLKAGIIPLHFWLPGAHAAAPSHVSAMMSGLVIKTGIYGLLRVLALLGGAPPWYGWILFGAGLTSGVLGVVWALAQHDLKRLLAYHSVENIGIILIGMGVGVLGTAYGLPIVATLGYAGAILHVLNHALFKGLLFLGAGAVARATGSRALDALGGLSRRMPMTGLAFLLGSVAIVGLPPLNGFVSEWTIVQALLGAGLGGGPIRAAVFGVGGIGLIGGLALACFAKVNGVVFLGKPRTPDATDAVEVGPLLLVPMGALALACVLIGLLPAVAVPPALAAAQIVTGTVAAGPGRDFARELGRVSAAALVLVAAVSVAWPLRNMLMRGRWRVVPDTWGCGYPLPTPRMQYTASSFAAPLLQPFGAATGLREEREGATFRTHAVDPGLEGAILPAWRRMQGATAGLRALQLGRLHVYLLYVLATVVALLAYLALWRAP
jgi:hydrogenase-4 component B